MKESVQRGAPAAPHAWASRTSCLRSATSASTLEIVPVRWIDKVLEVALAEAPKALPEEDEKAAPVKVEEVKAVGVDALEH
jgi:predicted ATP-dependent protease